MLENSKSAHPAHRVNNEVSSSNWFAPGWSLFVTLAYLMHQAECATKTVWFESITLKNPLCKAEIKFCVHFTAEEKQNWCTGFTPAHKPYHSVCTLRYAYDPAVWWMRIHAFWLRSKFFRLPHGKQLTTSTQLVSSLLRYTNVWYPNSEWERMTEK